MVLASVIKEANASSAARLATGVSSAEVQTATLEHINSGNTLLPNSVDNLSFMDKLGIASSSAKHDKSDMSDDTKFKDYISAQANARQALAKAGLPVDPEKVESIAASATGDAVLAYQQRCGGTSCSDPEVQDQTLKSQSVQVAQYVNLRVSQVLIANQSVTVNVAPPTPALAPSLGPDICALISAEHTRGLSCIKRGANLVRVHIQATFPAGRADDIRVRDSLRTLGEIMRSTGHTFDARFSASASRSRADCGVKDQAQANFTHPGGSTKVLCGADNLNDPLSAGELTQPSVERSGNFVLSLNRAIWSETTLSEAAGQSLASASLEALSSQTAWPTDSPDDRRVYVDLTTTH